MEAVKKGIESLSAVVGVQQLFELLIISLLSDSKSRQTANHNGSQNSDAPVVSEYHFQCNQVRKKGITPVITVKQAEHQQHVQISITDNGIGFDNAYAEKVFLPFQRLLNGNHEGSGIGLTICKTIVEAHGGKIAVKSRPGEVTQFILSLSKSA